MCIFLSVCFWTLCSNSSLLSSRGQKYQWDSSQTHELVNSSSFISRRDTQALPKEVLHFRHLFEGLTQIQLEHTFGEMTPDSIFKAFHSKVCASVQTISSWSSTNPYPQIIFMDHAQACPFPGLWSCLECINSFFQSLLPHPVLFFSFFFISASLVPFASFLTDTHSPHLWSTLSAYYFIFGYKVKTYICLQIKLLLFSLIMCSSFSRENRGEYVFLKQQMLFLLKINFIRKNLHQLKRTNLKCTVQLFLTNVYSRITSLLPIKV